MPESKGKPTKSAGSFVQLTHCQESHWLCCSWGYQVCAPGIPYTAIGAVCAAVAAKHKLTVVRDFIGHGVGTVFHAAPQVLHHNNTYPGKMQVSNSCC